MIDKENYNRKRPEVIPYGSQSINEKDIEAVCSVLRSDWLTTGPMVETFENAFASFVGSKYAVAVSSGTAALHCAMYALGIKKGDEILVPAISFVATANCVIYQEGKPVFVDINPDNILIDTQKIEKHITRKTKAIIAVDYSGHPCDYDELVEIANKYGIALISDSCHSLGAKYKDRNVGSLSDMSIFSFHPVKHITTGEGGMITTDSVEYATRIRQFRNHGINNDHKQRERQKTHFYEMLDLGYNYRITDIQCALGASQLKRVQHFLQTRHKIANIYTNAFKNIEYIQPLKVNEYVTSAYHLYVVKLKNLNRSEVFNKLREKKIGVNVHYMPIYLHPYYKKKIGTKKGLCINAEKVYEQIISLPIFVEMTTADLQYIIECINKLMD